MSARHLRKALSSLLIALTAVTAVGCSGGASSAPGGASANAAASARTVTVTDQWDRKVTVPANPSRVVVMEWEGLVVKSMQLMGLADRIVGVDTATKKETFRNVVVPSLSGAKDVGSAWSGVNYETVAALRPQVVFLEAWVASQENRTMHQGVVDRLTQLGIPVIVLLSPSNFDTPRLDTAWQFVTYVGEVFGQQERSSAIVSRLNAGITKVTSRLADVPQAQRPAVAVFASATYLMGTKSIQSTMITELLKARNVVGAGTFVTTSEEKLLALNPPHLVVIGHEGYISRDDVLGGRKAGIDWGKVSTMDAIRSKRLAILGYDEWRATIETPIALLKIAAMLYPDRFRDVDVAAEERAFYRDVFGLSAQDADRAIKGQEYAGELKR